MKAKEFITELFDKPVPYSLNSYGDAEFHIGDNVYKVEFVHHDAADIRGKTEPVDLVIFYDKEGTIEMTGNRNEFVVFSTVAKIILQYIQKNKPLNFSFAASMHEKSRMKLYDKLAAILEKKIPYSLEIYNEYNDRNYLFRRQQ